MQTFPMTELGAKLLNEELEQLKGIERPNIIQAIAEARAHGDLSENAEYHAAKEKQAFVEGRIAQIEAKLSRAQVIIPSQVNSEGKIFFGNTISLINTNTNEEFTYQIVGDDEADIKLNKISINSPVARSLIGKEVGDVIQVQAPNAVIEYEIIEIVSL